MGYNEEAAEVAANCTWSDSMIPVELIAVAAKKMRKAIYPLEKQIPAVFQGETTLSPGELVPWAGEHWRISLELVCGSDEDCPAPVYLPQAKSIVMAESLARDKTIAACVQTAHIISHAVQDQKLKPHQRAQSHAIHYSGWQDKVLMGYYSVSLLMLVATIAMSFYYDKLPQWAQKNYGWVILSTVLLGLPVLFLHAFDMGRGLVSIPFEWKAEANSEKIALYLLRHTGIINAGDKEIMKTAKRFLSVYSSWRQDNEPCVIYYDE